MTLGSSAIQADSQCPWSSTLTQCPCMPPRQPRSLRPQLRNHSYATSSFFENFWTIEYSPVWYGSTPGTCQQMGLQRELSHVIFCMLSWMVMHALSTQHKHGAPRCQTDQQMQLPGKMLVPEAERLTVPAGTPEITTSATSHTPSAPLVYALCRRARSGHSASDRWSPSLCFRSTSPCFRSTSLC